MHGLCKAHEREFDWRWPCGVQYLAMVMESNNTYPYPRVASHWSKVPDKTHGYLKCFFDNPRPKQVELVGREPSIQSQKEPKDSVCDYNLLSQHLGSPSTSILSNISISPVRFIVLISHQLHPELHLLQSPPVSNQKNQRPSLLTIRTYLNNLNHL